MITDNCLKQRNNRFSLIEYFTLIYAQRVYLLDSKKKENQVSRIFLFR